MCWISGDYRPGTRVNVETDVLAKHMRKLLGEAEGTSVDTRPESSGGQTGGLTIERLRKLGF